MRGFRRREGPKLTPEEAERQGRAVRIAIDMIGAGEALGFLNAHNDDLGGRPIDLAVRSESDLAVVAALLPHADPIHKVTIIPRGRALGVMMQLPEFDRHTHSKVFLEAQLAILMGGRVAEEMFTGRVTSGAGNDIERATDIARRMVCEFGMSTLGPLAYRPAPSAFESNERGVGMSEATAQRVDEVVAHHVRAFDPAHLDECRHGVVLRRWPRMA